MVMCVGSLIASEFMPVSLLTPIARDLHASDGAAGQAISVSGLFAVVTILLIATVASRFDRWSREELTTTERSTTRGESEE